MADRDAIRAFLDKAEEVGTADPNAAAIEHAIERGALSPAARDMPLDDVLEQYMHYAGLTSTEAAARILGITLAPIDEAELIASFPSTGTCLTKDCPGSYDAWGKCHTCGDVD